MKSYLGNEIRNVAVVGHAHSGKTTLISALLHAAHMTPRLGHVEDGSAVTAYDEEEVARRTTMQTAVAFAEWNGIKVNLVDTPGFHMFLHEARAAMIPVESALVVINTPCGLEPMTERVWQYAEEFNLPRVVVLNQMDHPRAAENVHSTINALREHFGRHLIPVQLPMVGASGFEGVVDLVTMQAFFYTPNGDGAGRIGDIPESMRETVKAAHEVLVELVAEGKDDLMEEFFAQGTIPEQHLITALHEAIREDRIFPVLFASGGACIATDHLLDFLKVYAPSPAERAPIAARAAHQVPSIHGAAMTNGTSHGHASADVLSATPSPGLVQEFVMRKVDDGEPPSLFVFKTMTDPFAGRISFFKVFSGVVKNDAMLANYSRHSVEKLSHLCVMQGHTAVPVADLHAGDLGAVAKLKETYTCDSLGDKGHDIFFEPVTVPEAAMTWAIEPRTRADEDKLAGALHKLMEEDLLVRFFRDPQTKEFLIAGAGQPHIEAVVSKLRRRYHTEVTLKAPKVPYRETIRSRAEAQGKHKKQTGGHGQYGDCKIRIEPLPRGSGFEFINDIFGGAIPRQYVPAVEKGIQEAAARGCLAGHPVTDFRATVYDGSFHEVDSNELSFKMAGRLAFRKCMEQARPALLEPVMRVEIDAPEEFAGALMGDLNQRRGRVQGMDSSGARNGTTRLHAEVPMAEMLSYGQTLTALTQGRGSFHMEMDHYDLVPQPIADKLIASAKRPAADEDES
ncbi:elongation factor G [Silvibacterium dinghuense]|uniref:Elongation factor G n=1 Tax=Silvibacterium dinghuense TaxID=1560006 RepID=A0A4Q1SK33_9BACT|nr:elongation factor G [Silvibacterium dinghuense]RXS98026.1 elongation factor G [Silvibacterium dinghuense]GGH03918.1 elongation factor G [Silvibacterium dinghuense]